MRWKMRHGAMRIILALCGLVVAVVVILSVHLANTRTRLARSAKDLATTHNDVTSARTGVASVAHRHHRDLFTSSPLPPEEKSKGGKHVQDKTSDTQAAVKAGVGSKSKGGSHNSLKTTAPSMALQKTEERRGAVETAVGQAERGGEMKMKTNEHKADVARNDGQVKADTKHASMQTNTKQGQKETDKRAPSKMTKQHDTAQNNTKQVQKETDKRAPSKQTKEHDRTQTNTKQGQKETDKRAPSKQTKEHDRTQTNTKQVQKETDKRAPSKQTKEHDRTQTNTKQVQKETDKRAPSKQTKEHDRTQTNTKQGQKETDKRAPSKQTKEHDRTQTNTKQGQEETDKRAPSKQTNAPSLSRTGAGNETKTQPKTKYLIYLCDKGGSCGGWGDRQRGIVNAYLLANVTGRRFGVNMSVPCDVTHFYVPNEVNWTVSEEEIAGKSRRFIRNVGDNSFHYSLLHLDFNRAFPQDVVFLRTNVEHYWNLRSNPHYKHVLPGWAWHGRPAFFKAGWSLLMKPAAELQALLDLLLQRVGFRNRTRPLVCAHVRIGVSESNPKDTEKRNDVSKLGPLWDFLDGYVSKGSQLFLATDNYRVRNMSRARFGSSHHDTGGAILHVDVQRHFRHACAGFQYALLDQLVLTRCDVLVTSDSMFSWRAALIRGESEGLFHYHDGVVKKVHLV